MNKFKVLIQNDWTISLLVHLVLLVVFTLVFFKVPRQTMQSVIELFTESYERYEVVKDDPGLRDKATDVTHEKLDTPMASAQTQNKTDNIPESDNKTPLVTAPVAKSDPLMPPTGGQSRSDNLSSSIPSSSYLSNLKNKLRGGGKGGNSFELDDGDGSITILSKVLPKTEIADYGKVTLQFKLKPDGSVAVSSVIPVLVDNPNYTRDAVNALQQWKFEVKRYNADQVYKISFIFKPE